MDTLQSRLNMVLKILNINQVQFSLEIGYSASYISKLISRGGHPRNHFYKAIEKAYNINAGWLKTGKGDMFITDGNGLSPKANLLIKKYYELSPNKQKIIDDILEAFLDDR